MNTARYNFSDELKKTIKSATISKRHFNVAMRQKIDRQEKIKLRRNEANDEREIDAYEFISSCIEHWELGRIMTLYHKDRDAFDEYAIQNDLSTMHIAGMVIVYMHDFDRSYFMLNRCLELANADAFEIMSNMCIVAIKSRCDAIVHATLVAINMLLHDNADIYNSHQVENNTIIAILHECGYTETVKLLIQDYFPLGSSLRSHSYLLVLYMDIIMIFPSLDDTMSYVNILTSYSARLNAEDFERFLLRFIKRIEEIYDAEKNNALFRECVKIYPEALDAIMRHFQR